MAKLVEQRVRNHVIDYFDLASSYELQLKYQRAVPIVYVPNEVINQWQDLALDRAAVEHSDVYSVEEILAIGRYHAVWDRVAEMLPKGFPTLRVVQALPCWDELRQAALSAREAFEPRGKMSDGQAAVH